MKGREDGNTNWGHVWKCGIQRMEKPFWEDSGPKKRDSRETNEKRDSKEKHEKRDSRAKNEKRDSQEKREQLYSRETDKKRESRKKDKREEGVREERSTVVSCSLPSPHTPRDGEEGQEGGDS